MRELVLACLLAISLSGCTQRVPYADLGKWNDDVIVLGPVDACQGGWCCPNGQCQWPLALTVPPPAETYHRALIDNAVQRYNVPADDVVLRQVLVTLHTEVVGTVRGWAAEAIAGRRPVSAVPMGAAVAPGALTVEDRLRTLKDLRDKGLISDEVFRQRQSAILEGL